MNTLNTSENKNENTLFQNTELQLDDHEISQNFTEDGLSVNSELSSNGYKSKNEYVCTICGEKLKSNCKLQSHIKKHLGNRQFVCATCDKGFRYNVEYQAHIRKQHTGEKPFVCSVCNKRFHSKKRVQQHRQSTHETKHYSCGYCRRTFIQIKHLKIHEKIHTSMG